MFRASCPSSHSWSLCPAEEKRKHSLVTHESLLLWTFRSHFTVTDSSCQVTQGFFQCVYLVGNSLCHQHPCPSGSGGWTPSLFQCNPMDWRRGDLHAGPGLVSPQLGLSGLLSFKIPRPVPCQVMPPQVMISSTCLALSQEAVLPSNTIIVCSLLL